MGVPLSKPLEQIQWSQRFGQLINLNTQAAGRLARPSWVVGADEGANEMLLEHRREVSSASLSRRPDANDTKHQHL